MMKKKIEMMEENRRVEGKKKGIGDLKYEVFMER